MPPEVIYDEHDGGHSPGERIAERNFGIAGILIDKQEQIAEAQYAGAEQRQQRGPQALADAAHGAGIDF